MYLVKLANGVQVECETAEEVHALVGYSPIEHPSKEQAEESEEEVKTGKKSPRSASRVSQRWAKARELAEKEGIDKHDAYKKLFSPSQPKPPKKTRKKK